MAMPQWLLVAVRRVQPGLLCTRTGTVCWAEEGNFGVVLESGRPPVVLWSGLLRRFSQRSQRKASLLWGKGIQSGLVCVAVPLKSLFSDQL